MQSGLSKRIEEKENERDSFELQISNVNISHIDDREKNLVRNNHAWFFVYGINNTVFK